MYKDIAKKKNDNFIEGFFAIIDGPQKTYTQKSN